jgi:hypothetical protein
MLPIPKPVTDATPPATVETITRIISKKVIQNPPGNSINRLSSISRSEF